MGLANQSAKSIANTGAIFGFTTSTMDAYQEAFLYTPDIDTMRRLVLAALNTSAQQITSEVNQNQLSYGEVISLLKQYESNCQPASIRSLVNQAIGNAVPSTPIDSQTAVATAALALGLQRDMLTQEQTFYLYWLQSDKLNAAKDLPYLNSKLAGLNFAYTGEKLDPDNVKKLMGPYLKLFSSKAIASWNDKIVTEQNKIPAIATTTTTQSTTTTTAPVTNTTTSPVATTATTKNEPAKATASPAPSKTTPGTATPTKPVTPAVDVAATPTTIVAPSNTSDLNKGETGDDKSQLKKRKSFGIITLTPSVQSK